jgi:lipopolysaccharide transport system ATP-binding protein
VGDKLTLKIKVKCNTNLDKLVLGYSIKDRLGQIMFGTNTWHTQQIINEVTAGDTFVFSIKFNANFGVGSYSIQTALVDSDTHLTANYEWVDLAYIFSLVNNDKYIFNGCIWNDPEIEIQKLIT